jgi:hypothetical protein
MIHVSPGLNPQPVSLFLNPLVLGQRHGSALRLAGENVVLQEGTPASFSFSQNQTPPGNAPSLNTHGTGLRTSASLSAADAQYALQQASRKIMAALSPLFGPEWVLNLKLKATQQTPAGAVSIQSSAASTKTAISLPPSGLPQSFFSEDLKQTTPQALYSPVEAGFESDVPDFDDSTEATLAQMAYRLENPLAPIPVMKQPSYSTLPESF